MVHTHAKDFPRGTIALGVALALSLALPAAEASAPGCTTADLNHPKFQRRPEMDRCEGITPLKPIAANLLVLTSYTIGQATPQPSPRTSERGGSVFALQIPVVEPVQADPEVAVTARKGNYRMDPLRFSAPKRGWKGFTWGAAVIQGQRIASERLRATALLKPPGDSQQVLPVRFAPASSYRLVMSTDASLTVTSVRILDLNKRKVADCAGPGTRIDPDLLCTWNAANLPAGTYTLQARDEAGKTVLNQLLRHDPRWLKR
ncbi:MAG: hypothetical protein VKO26_01510 [Cyanobacteriota bacterium]|nr:hypothetical protein [Cyanobacteriota bacterium]